LNSPQHLLPFFALLACGGAVAAPSDYVVMPQIEYGEHEIDFKAGSATADGGGHDQAASIGYGYGVNEKWFTEFYLKYERAAGEAVRFDAIEWENKFQLTEPGRYPVDLGFFTEFEVPRDRSEGYEVKVGLLAQTDFDKLQLNGNLLLGRQFRASGDDPHDAELGYQWQAKYRWHPKFEFGLQGFGEFGKWNHWAPHDEQNHRMGPAVFGKLALGGRQAIRYNAAWLVGASKAAPDHTLRVQVEYEF
jgi:hypothetical protein